MTDLWQQLVSDAASAHASAHTGDEWRPVAGLNLHLGNQSPRLIFRGMSSGEWRAATANGYFRSNGHRNDPDQRHQTYFSGDPFTAISFALNNLCPLGLTTGTHPAFIIAIDWAPNAPVEIGVPGKIGLDAVHSAWELTHVAYRQIPMPGSAHKAKLTPAIPNAQRLVTAAYRAAPDIATRGPHGPGHWLRVALRGAALLTDETDPAIVLAFAVLHDTQRDNDGPDPEHGARAATLANELQAGGILRFEPKRLTLLKRALTEHDQGGTTNDPTIGACWDADRLELGRVGREPNPDLLSTAAARAFAGNVPHMDMPRNGWAGVIERFRSAFWPSVLIQPCNENSGVRA